MTQPGTFLSSGCETLCFHMQNRSNQWDCQHLVAFPFLLSTWDHGECGDVPRRGSTSSGTGEWQLGQTPLPWELRAAGGVWSRLCWAALGGMQNISKLICLLVLGPVCCSPRAQGRNEQGAYGRHCKRTEVQVLHGITDLCFVHS